MNNEDKVISLELAKKIDKEHKRLGIEVKSEFYWVFAYGGWWIKTNEEINSLTYSGEAFETYPAHDVAELGEMLPKEIIKDGKEFRLKLMGVAHIEYINDDFPGDEYGRLTEVLLFKDICCEKTEAETRGKMRLWLLINDYIKAVKK